MLILYKLYNKFFKILFCFFLIKKKTIIKKTKIQNSSIVKQKNLIVYKIILKVTRNNFFITVINPIYGHVYYSSGGLKYFFLRKESVAAANNLLGENLGLELRSKLINIVDVDFLGIPLKSHKIDFIKGLIKSQLLIRSISDKTPLAYNGCYRKKRRRKKLRRR